MGTPYLWQALVSNKQHYQIPNRDDLCKQWASNPTKAFSLQMPYAEPKAYLQSRYFAEMNADPIFGRFLPHTLKTANHFAQKTHQMSLAAKNPYGLCTF